MKKFVALAALCSMPFAQAIEARPGPHKPLPAPPASGSASCASGALPAHPLAVTADTGTAIRSQQPTSIYIDGPPGSANLDPSRFSVFCQAGAQLCPGGNCNGHPKISWSALTWSRNGNYHSLRWTTTALNWDQYTHYPVRVILARTHGAP